MGSISELVIKTRQNSFLVKLTAVLAGSFALAISAQLAIPMFPVPITMQTLVVVLLGYFLGKHTAAATVLAYLAEGSMGLPVFASGGLGLAHLIGPTGGYLLAFVPAAYFSGLLLQKEYKSRWITGTVIMALMLGILFVGSLWLSIFCGMKTAFTVGFLPFLPGLGIKTLLAFMILPFLK
jgi:biotin transport system substrate-specific component